tara:strand:- start:581 stop:835 length:255 start_codon:yes stop_codon:yes gene_type:complete
MIKKINKKELFLLTKRSLKCKKEKINEKSKINSPEEWDSLGHLNLLASLDERFKGKIADKKDFGEATSMKKIIKALSKYKLLSK